MKCYYHKSDLDGHCSGALVKLKYPECEMIGVNYQDHPITCCDFEEIFIVDFCFNEDDMNYLINNATVHWIDHHKSSIEGMNKWAIKEQIPLDEVLKGKQEIEKAGCELTWKYLFPNKKDARICPFTW